MTDRLYCKEGNQFALYNFETRQVTYTDEHPHPDGNKLFPPFYVDIETFWGIIGRIKELDVLNEFRREKNRWET